MRTVRAGQRRFKRHKDSFMADQRGAVAFETIIVFSFMMFSLLFPLADLAFAGFQYISAREALRGFGQSIQYSPPPDVTNTSSWASTALAKADSRYPIPSIQVLCGSSTAATCSPGNMTAPRYYSYSTTITLAPLVLRSVLCTSSNADPCTYTLPYSERFL